MSFSPVSHPSQVLNKNNLQIKIFVKTLISLNISMPYTVTQIICFRLTCFIKESNKLLQTPIEVVTGSAFVKCCRYKKNAVNL